MTAISPEAKRRRDFTTLAQRDEAGIIARTAASFYITVAIVLIANAAPIEPRWWALVLPIGIGPFVLLPREQLTRMIIDVPILLITAVMGLSIAWSLAPAQAIFEFRRDVTLIIAVTLLAGAFDRDLVVKALLRGLYIGVGITVVALIVNPDTRSHLPAEGSSYSIEYPGWHGLFIHKNAMSPFLVFAAATIALFERNRWVKGAVLPIIVVLLVGSQSATGLLGVMVAAALFLWFRIYHRTEGRSSGAFVVASAAVTIIAIMGAIASVGVITAAYGKDLTFSGRTDIWSAALNAAADKPLLGYGQGGVFWEANSVTRDIWADIGFVVPHAHSGILDVLLTLGLVGVALYLVKFATTISIGGRMVSAHPRVGEWLLSVTAAQLIMGLSETVFTGDWLVYVAVMRGVALRLEQGDRRDRLARHHERERELSRSS